MQLIPVTANDVEKIDDMDFSNLHDVKQNYSLAEISNSTVAVSFHEKQKGISVSTLSTQLHGSITRSKGSGVKRGRRNTVKPIRSNKRIKFSTFMKEDISSSKVVGSGKQPHHES